MIIVTHDSDLKKIADRMYYIRDGKISHTFTKDELLQLRQSENTGEIPDSQARGHAKQVALLELREVSHILTEKINKIEKELHPL